MWTARKGEENRTIAHQLLKNCRVSSEKDFNMRDCYRDSTSWGRLEKRERTSQIELQKFSGDPGAKGRNGEDIQKKSRGFS